MMTRAFFCVLAVLLILYIYHNVKKNLMSQDESILWMLGALFILILGIWPGLVGVLASCVGIDYAPSLLFLLACIFLLIFVFRNSQQLSILREKNKELIQNVALLEKRIRDLEVHNKIQTTTSEKE